MGVAGGCGLWPVWVVVAVVDENGRRDNILFYCVVNIILMCKIEL